MFEEVPLSLLASLFGFLSQDLAIDLGTANTLVYVRGKGIVINEPSIVAIDQKTDQILAIGHEAKKMLGRTPGNIVAVRPMRNGVIDNPDVTHQMLSYFINQVHQRSTFVRPRMVVCIPSRISQVEQRAVKDSARLAGAREVYLIEEPLAAAIGAGLPIMEPSGNMVIDIGGGTTDIAVISLGGIVYSESIKVAGDQMDEDIIHYIRKKHNLLIGDAMGERIKMEVGSACVQSEPRSMVIKGRDLVHGLPKTLKVTDEEIREALSDTIARIIQTIQKTLENTPPELSADIIDRGIVLTGGGSMLKGLDTRIRDEIHLPIVTVDNPLTTVVMGTGKTLEELDVLKKVSIRD